jgi:tripartite-type tricarboxylate transporter receptor subunit TctC
VKKALSMILILVLALSFVVAGGQSESAESAADKWPNQPINLVVAFAAGGNSDYNARAIGKYLSKELGQPVVVTNVAGSGGSIAAAQVKDAKNDGYTILVSQLSMNLAQAAGMVDFGYADFELACVFSASADEVLVANADAPFNNVQELIEVTQREPGKYKITANTGASTQWISIGLQEAGAKLNVVSAGGSGERLPLLLGRHVDIIPMPYNMVQDYVDKGQFKYIANVSNERSEALPNLPTLRESGVNAGYSYFNTMFFPKGTDRKIVEKFSAAVGEIITTNAEYQKEMAALGQAPTYMNPADTLAHWSKELEEMMKISDLLQGK